MYTHTYTVSHKSEYTPHIFENVLLYLNTEHWTANTYKFNY